MRVLFVTSEVAPLVKTGGLADVSAALPAALQRAGIDVRVLLPGYAQVMKGLEFFRVEAVIQADAGFPEARLFSSVLPSGVPLLVLDCPALFARGGGLYQDENGHDWGDNAIRFGLLSKVAALLGCHASPLEWLPDIVHCNDWQSGLTPAYLRYLPGGVPSVMTVHNLAFQGVFPAQMHRELGLPPESFQPEGVEYYGNLSFLKAGLHYANHITTVSPTYAQEIQSEALGFGMQGVLRSRRDQLTGILNGIDEHEWDPAADPALAHSYDLHHLEGKAENKRALQQKLGLHVDSGIPLFGMVSRFTYQKGTDVVLEAAAQLLELPAQLVMLGSGDAALQARVQELGGNYPGKVAAVVGFDEGLSHMIEAGADVFLMPSRFEPCGLNQMYSQRYGTPPIVNATGGLVDSVVDYTSAALAQGTASGFVLREMSSYGLLECAQRAIACFQDKTIWATLQKNGMRRNFSWQGSAAIYRDIYAQLAKAHH